MSKRSFLTRVLVVVTAGSLLATLTSCATEPAPEAAGPVSADCQNLFALQARGSGPHLVVVEDATQSSSVPELGVEADKVITAASRSNGTVSVLAVDGAGAPPNWVGKDLPLNDAAIPDDTSVHQRIADLAPSCVRALASTAAPAAGGSDILGALQLAATELGGSGQLLVATDGMANAGMLDFAKQRYGVEPTAIVAALASLGQIPRLQGVTVVISGLGAVSGPVVNQTIVDWVVAVYEGICTASGAASCTVTSGTAANSVVRANLPDDAAVPFPVLEPPTVNGEACVYTLGSAVLFGGDSAVLDPAADLALRDFITRVQGAGTRVRVTGHTTTFGDAAGNQTLSELRGAAVLQRLIALGMDPAMLSSVGKGGTEPLVTPDIDSSGIIESAAAKNRRVELAVTGLTRCG